MAYVVSAIHLNDYDRAVYAFWYSAVKRTDALCTRISDTDCTLETWEEQRAIWRNRDKANLLDLGFATFFLNRTNRSGILDAGVIGGKNQAGKWKIDARYNRDNLISRIEAIGQFRSRIKVYNQEAKDFLQQLQPELPKKTLVYLDPPYVEKGPGLYLNHYREEDHRALARLVTKKLHRPWMVSYDAHPLVRECYGNFEEAGMNLPYSAYGNARRGTELVYFSKGLAPPDMSGKTSRYHQPWEEFEAA